MAEADELYLYERRDQCDKELAEARLRLGVAFENKERCDKMLDEYRRRPPIPGRVVAILERDGAQTTDSK
jgi:hypothetical protein